MLILPFSAIIIKDVPDWEWLAFVKSKECVFVNVHMLCQSNKKKINYNDATKIMPTKLYTSLLCSMKVLKPYIILLNLFMIKSEI